MQDDAFPLHNSCNGVQPAASDPLPSPWEPNLSGTVREQQGRSFREQPMNRSLALVLSPADSLARSAPNPSPAALLLVEALCPYPEEER